MSKRQSKTHAKKAPKAPKQETKTDSVVITMVVDESGSMASLFNATVAGFNEYVDTLKRDLKDVRSYFSAIKFDTRGVRKLQVGSPIEQAIHLSSENYQPSGGTPLLDAIGKSIAATDEVMAQQNGSKAIVVIQTDGYENASVEFDLARVKTLIEERQGVRGWQFVFIGAGINAFADAARMGIIGANTMSYSPDVVGTTQTFRATASNTQMFGSGQAATMNYSSLQSQAAGESAHITAAKFKAPKPKPDNSTAISSLTLTGE